MKYFVIYFSELRESIDLPRSVLCSFLQKNSWGSNFHLYTHQRVCKSIVLIHHFNHSNKRQTAQRI